MNVRQLQAFLAVAEHLHFGRAAEQLFMAQAPLSRTIQALEGDLGTRLFERNTRSVSLTPAGRALIEPARQVLEAVACAETAVRAAVSGESGIVRVEFCGVAAHPLVAALSRAMRADHPGIRLDLTSQAVSRPTIRRLLDEEVDVGLGRFDNPPPGLDSEVLIADSLVVAVPRTHRLAGSQVVGFQDVASEPFVSLPYATGSVTTDRLWRLGYAHGAGGVNNVQFAPDTFSCLALVGAEVGCHLALRSVARTTTNPNVVFLPLAQRECELVPDVHLRVAWRSGATTLPVEAALGHLRRHLRQNRPAVAA
ncbi:LysR substrate-binding domain-containing protein [Streptomyces sp. DSM 40750]|uniref:LysR substrate-binding domain-containing protein n=1 Tax=Streptomyces sp. DSM 40750 TaxID=2801030 RepID=UPI00214C0F67|nr:LysR substrate-binding domain-containing protein [Streptomyces sp. DSM 40750]UUU19125.1 LysR substrate-binding domain-containing protein [Streptomyces sp. DSM 40750]UUU27531.1 LysR substrate-binding domain-containing protein [Streptomyces sp. DSM 40750]